MTVHLAGTKLRVGLGVSTVRPSFDLETYSEAGFEWSEADGKWLKTCTDAKGRGGLPAVGAAVYAQHPTTEILSMVYDLKDGLGARLWLPGQPLPADFCAHITAGGEIEAHGAKFELWIWEYVAVPRYGFPPIHPTQLYCSMGKARAWSLPPALADVGEVLGIEHQKDAEGKRLLDRFSVPRKPTKKDPRKRIRPEEDPVDGPRLYAYNARDVLAEDEVSAATPDMPADRRAYWLLDLAINKRGIPVDRAGVENCIVVLEQALERYNAELAALTGGCVEKASEVQKLVGWLAGKGCYVDSLDQEAVEGMLGELRGRGLDSSDPCLRALEIRQAVGSASVKKVYALRGQMTAANRVHDLFTVDGARTGRCIAEGQLVLTRALDGRVSQVPIEQVHLEDQLWDGKSWVAHSGVVASGEQEVIEYDGLRATPDHVVFTSANEYTTLRNAASLGARLWRGEACTTSIESSPLQNEHTSG